MLQPRAEIRLRRGHPWVFSNELAPVGKGAPPVRLAAGTCVVVESSRGRGQGSFFFHPDSLISARRYSHENDVAPDVDFWARRLARAEAMRAPWYAEPWYRLAHGEADGFPGLVIDRFGDDFVVRTESAGMERVRAPLLEAITRTFSPRAVVARDDSPLRTLEGLSTGVSVPIGEADLPARILVPEGGLEFLADLRQGQKTGWFYDQQPQRALVRTLARGRRVLDLHCGSGGFALQAAAGGAESVLAVDSSAFALTLAAESAEHNDARAPDLGMARSFSETIDFREDDAQRALTALATEKRRFELVIVDPPAFARRKRDRVAALRAYGRLAKFAARVVSPGGFLLFCSCSHHAEESALLEAVARAIGETERTARLVSRGGAGPDHPILVALPESAYLKAFLLRL